MLRICFKQQAEEGYSRVEGRPSRVLESEIAPRNIKKVLNLPPKKTAGDRNNFASINRLAPVPRPTFVIFVTRRLNIVQRTVPQTFPCPAYTSSMAPH